MNITDEGPLEDKAKKHEDERQKREDELRESMKAEGCEFISKCKIEIADEFYLVKVFEYITRQTKMKCRIQNKMYWIYTKLCEKII